MRDNSVFDIFTLSFVKRAAAAAITTAVLLQTTALPATAPAQVKNSHSVCSCTLSPNWPKKIFSFSIIKNRAKYRATNNYQFLRNSRKGEVPVQAIIPFTDSFHQSFLKRTFPQAAGKIHGFFHQLFVEKKYPWLAESFSDKSYFVDDLRGKVSHEARLFNAGTKACTREVHAGVFPSASTPSAVFYSCNSYSSKARRAQFYCCSTCYIKSYIICDVVQFPRRNAYYFWRPFGTHHSSCKEVRRSSCKLEAKERHESYSTVGSFELWSPKNAKRAPVSVAMDMNSSTSDTPVSLELDEHEKELFDLLLHCVKDQKLDVTLRAAGGWVRDKLLKRKSDDIDIAIDKMSGVEFTSALNRYFVDHGLPSQVVGVVAANPEQSKHLETATCRLLKRFHVDFVNLRTEKYTEKSRIPHAVGFGLPEEDAFRRDFTVNALFYNLHTHHVEDFTGTGLQDLRDGILRTPLANATATLQDDPLRVLRAVRFAARFNMRLDDNLLHAAQQEEIHEALVSKVSRERIGNEIKKLFLFNNDGCLMLPTPVTIPSGSPGVSDVCVKPSRIRDRDSQNKGYQSCARESTNTLDTVLRVKNEEGEIDNEMRGGIAKPGKVACSKKATTLYAACKKEAAADAEQAATASIANIVAATATAVKGFELLIQLGLVSCVFAVDDDILASARSADVPCTSCASAAASHAKKTTNQFYRHIGETLWWHEGSELKIWWARVLRCAYVIRSLFAAFCMQSETGEKLLHEQYEAHHSHEVDNSSKNGKNITKELKGSSTGKKFPHLDLKEVKGISAEAAGLLNREFFCSGEMEESRFRAFMLAAFLYPLLEVIYLSERRKPEELVFLVIVTSLKLPRKDAERALLLLRGAQDFLTFYEKTKNTLESSSANSIPPSSSNFTAAIVGQNEGRPGSIEDYDGNSERVQLGLLVRSIGRAWPQALLLAAAIAQTKCRSSKNASPFHEESQQIADKEIETAPQVAPLTQQQTIEETKLSMEREAKKSKGQDGANITSSQSRKHKERNLIGRGAEALVKAAKDPLDRGRLMAFVKLRNRIEETGVAEAWKLKPFHDGHAIQNLLPNLSKGPLFKSVLDEQVRWQLLYPLGTKEESTSFLRSKFREYL